MTSTNVDEPSNMLPPVVDDQLPPVANVPDPAQTIADQVPPAALPANFPLPSSGAGVLDVPEEANDVDLIEKEWVDKAKQIVEHTAEDPFTQQEEIGKIKADYLKKRYNKDLGA